MESRVLVRGSGSGPDQSIARLLFFTESLSKEIVLFLGVLFIAYRSVSKYRLVFCNYVLGFELLGSKFYNISCSLLIQS